MNMQNIQRKDTEDGICVLTFDRANSSANIFDKDTLLELQKHIDDISGAALKGLVIISAKQNIFIAGADLNLLATLRDGELKEYLQLGQTIFNHLADLKIPTVAAIHGACVGGGFELSLACDYRVATDERATKIGLPEVNLGILPAWGGSTRLPRLIGLTGALDLILGGKTLAAKPALKRGMINLIAPREYLLQAALKMLHHGKPHRFLSHILHSPPVNKAISLAISKYVEVKVVERAKGHYPAVLKAKDVIMSGAAQWSREKSLAMEADAVTELAKTEASRNLLKLFMQQESAKKFTLPSAPILPPRKMSRAAVIGAGVMGASIAQWLSAHGMRVVLKDVDAARVAAGMDRVKQLFAAGYKRDSFTFVEARDGFDRISPMPSDFPMKSMEIIIEAAVEKMDLKKQIFAKLDEQAPPGAILATNTSALSITEIAGAVKNPARVVGIHFFNPVHKMQLVEVVKGRQTSPEVVQRAVKFVQQIGKLPVVVQDSPGFLVNRILLPYMVEAASLFENGAKTETIDDAMIDFGMPMGPLRLIDEVGVDISADVAATLADKFRDRLRTPELLTKMIEAGLLGRKSGSGFYIHKGREPRVSLGVGKFRTGSSAAGYSLGELQRRMVLLMVNEAARCLEEQVVATPGDVDFGMVMGTGFAPFRGGPLAYADSKGIVKIVDDMKTLVQAGSTQYEPCALLSGMAESGKKFYAD